MVLKRNLADSDKEEIWYDSRSIPDSPWGLKGRAKNRQEIQTGDHDEDSDYFWSALEDDPQDAPEGGSEDDFLDTSELTHMR